MATGVRAAAGAAAVRALVAAFGDAGHAFPAIALGRALAERGHEVTVETWERWREPIEGLGLAFAAAEEYRVFPPPRAGEEAGAGEAALAMLPLLDGFEPDVVVSDVLTLAPALAAELRGVPRATLIPHLYPAHEPGLPIYGIGMEPPRTAAGRCGWRAALPLLETGLRIGRRELNETRARVGLAPLDRFHGGISERLAIVGTFPQLEYPRQWPAEAVITGPLEFELPHPPIELPAGGGPLVLVAASTAQDPGCELIRRTFDGLAREPVRVVATTNGHRPARPIAVPANGLLVDWLSYSQVMAAAGLVVCHGGHGTIARALALGRPLLVSPAVGDMAENAARVAWAGAGLTVPGRLRRPATLRWATRTLLGDDRYRRAAERIAASGWAGGGAERAAEAVESIRY
ncbi:MAG: glycosyl transferase [Acidobacteria bacterium]|nr:MAG: glycosyl transferase [Acidobacteriota bacterium]MCL4286629.1 glycosyl transferase [Thermoleophilia bacterium]